MKTRITALALCLCLMFIMTPKAAAQTPLGSDYTDIPALAAGLDRVFSGEAGLYLDAECTKPASTPLGTSAVPLGKWYYVREASGSLFSGTSCYIYANGVYATLFGDVPYHGSSETWRVSECVAAGGGVSYEKFADWDVRTGALLRTTPHSNGEYSSDKGHSIIILTYDSGSVTYLEGNGDGKGLIRIVTRSWKEFDRVLLGGRGYSLSFIVQPTADYYASLEGELIGYLSYNVRYPGYGDVLPAAWYRGGVTSAVRLGLMNGRGQGLFRPEGTVTAAEAVTMAARLCSLYWGDGWSFISEGVWYAPYYAYLRQWGVSLPDRGPNEPVSRLELAELLYRVMPKNALNEKNGETYFPDCGSEAVLALRRAGVITGSGGLFRPNGYVTRAEAAAMLSRIADTGLRK